MRDSEVDADTALAKGRRRPLSRPATGRPSSAHSSGNTLCKCFLEEGKNSTPNDLDGRLGG
jgi:hypothetical protein